MKTMWKAILAIWGSTAIAIGVALYYTHNIRCLWFLLIPACMRFRSNDEAERKEEQESSEDNENNLCSSCTNIGCEFQSGIVRTKCAFYMPPHIESDNCGNYVVMQSVAESEE